MRGKLVAFVFSLVALSGVCAPVAGATTNNNSRVNCEMALLSFQDWMAVQESMATDLMMRNVSPHGAARGAVIASPSTQDPNYFFHWIRDAALVMNTVIDLYERAASPAEQNRYLRQLIEFAQFSRQNQVTWTYTDLGEPKFNADGSAYLEPWGRPQNDGPALRAVTMTRLARILLDHGEHRLVRELFYGSVIPADTLIKADLEYVSHHWRESSFDLWEEVSGAHFYTLMVQRRALLDGAALAERLHDGGAARWYREQAAAISERLEQFYDHQRGYIVATLDRTEGAHYKDSGIDIAVILALLHGSRGDGFFSVADPRVMATAYKIEEAFAQIYSVNQTTDGSMPLIGRYPEDQYYGGNPWILTTHAMAEYYYRLAREISMVEKLTINESNKALFQRLMPQATFDLRRGPIVLEGRAKLRQLLDAIVARGDAYMGRVQQFISDGHMAEQIHRDTGEQLSARDLTWSYSSFLTAYWARPGFAR